MKKLFIYGLLLLFTAVSCNKSSTPAESDKIEPRGKNNIAYQWAEMALTATALDTERFSPRPTITSRYLALIFVAMFDAWSRFDDHAIPMYLKDVKRVPENQRTLSNKEVAISYAAYHTLKEYYYSDSNLYKKKMKSLGLDPEKNSLDATTPAGIGNLAAINVIEERKGDGSNQYAEEGFSMGKPYFDYTHYEPINSADTNHDINRWQPKYFTDRDGSEFAPGCLTPYWHLVTPLAIDSASEFRPGPPPYYGSTQLKNEVREVVDLQANITEKEKALVEFMRDGPKSVQQAGHWLVFAQDVSRRDSHTLDQDVKMYFYVEMVAMDAFIANWDSKMHYDFARPYALVHNYLRDSTIYGWYGPDKGWGEMKGQDWRPYSPSSFLCPPFPSYTSGHSTVSGGCGEALKLFTGDDSFGVTVKRVPGILTEPNNLGDTVELYFPTFTKAADMAGISRVLGGYHIQADNIEGLNLGRKVAHKAWEKYNYHLGRGPNSSRE